MLRDRIRNLQLKLVNKMLFSVKNISKVIFFKNKKAISEHFSAIKHHGTDVQDNRQMELKIFVSR